MDTEFWIRAAQQGSIFHQIKQPLAMTRVHGDAKTTQLQKVLYEEHKHIVRRYRDWRLSEGGTTADFCYIFLNRFWRFVAAMNRFIYRKDKTFMMAASALRKTDRVIH